MSVCEYCEHNVYDEEYDEYYCNVNLDEDEMARFMSGNDKECAYYKSYDEYKMVQKQN